MRRGGVSGTTRAARRSLVGAGMRLRGCAAQREERGLSGSRVGAADHHASWAGVVEK
jgi:hypothetical protein